MLVCDPCDQAAFQAVAVIACVRVGVLVLLRQGTQQLTAVIKAEAVVLVDDVFALAQVRPGSTLDLLVGRRTGDLVAVVRVDVLGDAAVGIRRGFHGDGRQDQRIRRHKDHKAYGHR